MAVRSVQTIGMIGLLVAGLAPWVGGCGATSVLNAAFLNQLTGGVVPVTPGPSAKFVLVLGANETDQTIEFIITVETSVLQRDDDGAFQIDEDGEFVTRPERQTVRLFTTPNGGARRMGTLFSCDVSPVTLIGLGENLLPTDRHISVGGGGPTGIPGSGVTVPNLNPLPVAGFRPDGSFFNCGDTIIFQAFQNNTVPGNVSVQVFLLPGSEQPSVFSGPSTFANLANFQAAQRREDE